MPRTKLERKATPTILQEKESNLCISRLTLAATAESGMAEFVYHVKADAMDAETLGTRKVNAQNLGESKTRPRLQQDFLRPPLPGRPSLRIEGDHQHQAPHNEPGATANHSQEGMSTV